MARRDTPVARATADTPPAPAAATSAAATSRRKRSSRCGSISRNRRRIAVSATIRGIRYQPRFHNMVHLFCDDPLGRGQGPGPERRRGRESRDLENLLLVEGLARHQGGGQRIELLTVRGQ